MIVDPVLASSFRNSTDGDGESVPRSGRTKTKREFPTLISSPDASVRSVIGTPFTNVLFLLLRSWILNSPPLCFIRQCFRETDASRTGTKFVGSRPIDI